MSYRTLEEKFIADYEHLEEENSSLRQKVKELESQLQKDSDGNFILDTMVNKAGRNKLFDDCMLYYAPRTLDGDKGLEEWAFEYCNDGGEIPTSVSFKEFFDYFIEEFENAWEEKYNEEVDECNEE